MFSEIGNALDIPEDTDIAKIPINFIN